MLKIIIVGDINGEFNNVFTKISTINEKHGPFSSILCVGNFFGNNSHQLLPYIEGSKKIVIPTYFIVSDDKDTSLIDGKNDGHEICPNLWFLGRYGVRNINGLHVAYLSGIYKSEFFSLKGNEIVSIVNKRSANEENEKKETESNEKLNHNHEIVPFRKYYCNFDLKKLNVDKIDILLTSEWPRGFHYGIIHGLDSTPLPSTMKDPACVGSPIVSKLVCSMAPQYHFASNEDIYFTLLPYSNNKFPNVTRFIALGKTISQHNSKSIYACNIAPLSSLTNEKYENLKNENPKKYNSMSIYSAIQKNEW